MTAAERKRAQRQRDREKGVCQVAVLLTEEQRATVDRAYFASMSNFRMTKSEFYALCLVTGAKFRANSGGSLMAGNKMKRDKNDSP